MSYFKQFLFSVFTMEVEWVFNVIGLNVLEIFCIFDDSY